MIEQIRIRNLGVIEDALLEPHPGFTAVTGETGAGKTMVLTGLELLLGGRAEAGAVRRAGNDRAEVEGQFRVPEAGPVARRVADAGGDLDEGTLVLARTVTLEGRSRAHAGGRTVPAALLAELGQDLVAVHGQSDQQRLLAPSRQRAALDRYAGAAAGDAYRAYRTAWTRLRAVEAELAELTTAARERLREADLLRHGLDEITAADPQRGEDATVRAEIERLAHVEALREAATAAHAALSQDAAYGDARDVQTLLGDARRALDAQRDHDPALAALGDRMGELGVMAADLAAELAAYAASIDADPARLAALEERRAVLTGLTRRYGAGSVGTASVGTTLRTPAPPLSTTCSRGRGPPPRDCWSSTATTSGSPHCGPNGTRCRPSCDGTALPSPAPGRRRRNASAPP